METGNDQLVGVTRGGIAVMAPKSWMTKEEALRHAAWLVCLAEDNEGDFQKQLDAVQGC